MNIRYINLEFFLDKGTEGRHFILQYDALAVPGKGDIIRFVGLDERFSKRYVVSRIDWAF